MEKRRMVHQLEEMSYVDGLTGATVTSKTVQKCVSSAVAVVTGADTSSSATTWGE